jgi:hypothetical protein
LLVISSIGGFSCANEVLPLNAKSDEPDFTPASSLPERSQSLLGWRFRRSCPVSR